MAVLLTAGCGLFGGGDSESDASSDASTKAGPLEKTTLNVGVMVGLDCSGAQIALLDDLFKEEGLTIKPETVQSGQVAIPKLAAGSLDFTFGNWVSFMRAQSEGLVDMRFVSESYIATPNSNLGIITVPNSGVNGVKDLVGKKVAVNALGNINELLIRSVFEANDVNIDDVELVPMAFPEMAGNLASGAVQAAATIDPFVVQAQQTLGAKLVVDLSGPGPTENWPVAGFATTAKFAKENPNTVAAFQRVLLKGQELAGDRKNVEEALPKYANMPPEVAAIVRMGTFPTTIDAKRLQRVADALFSYDMLKKELDVEPLVIRMPAAAS